MVSGAACSVLDIIADFMLDANNGVTKFPRC